MITSIRDICAGAWVMGSLLGVALLMRLFADLDGAQILQMVAGVPLSTWLLATTAWLAGLLLRAWRVQREWTRFGAVTFDSCLRLVALHGAGLMVMPVRLGEIGYVHLVHRYWNVDIGRAMRSLIWMRWQDATFLFAAAVAFAAPLSLSSRLALAAALWLAGAFVLPGLATGALGRWRPLRRWRWAAGEHAPDRFGWWASAASWSLRIGAAALLMAALVPSGPTQVLAWAVGGEMSNMLPVQGVGGLGTYEAAVWGVARLQASDARGAVAAAVVVHGLVIVLTLACGLLAWLTAPDAKVAGTLEASPS